MGLSSWIFGMIANIISALFCDYIIRFMRCLWTRILFASYHLDSLQGLLGVSDLDLVCQLRREISGLFQSSLLDRKNGGIPLISSPYLAIQPQSLSRFERNLLHLVVPSGESPSCLAIWLTGSVSKSVELLVCLIPNLRWMSLILPTSPSTIFHDLELSSESPKSQIFACWIKLLDGDFNGILRISLDPMKISFAKFSRWN